MSKSQALLKPVKRSLFDAIMGTSPYSYWPMNEVNGALGINHGSYRSAGKDLINVAIAQAAVTGPDGGKAPWFDGTNSYSSVELNSWPGPKHGTEVVWVKVPAAGWEGTDHGIWHLTQGGGVYHQASVRIGNLGFQTGVWTGNMNKIVAASVYDWICIACTHDKDRDIQRYYCNGVENLPPTAYLFADAFTWPVLIGCWEGPVGLFLGSLCHLAFWDRVLTAGEIASISNAGGK